MSNLLPEPEASNQQKLAGLAQPNPNPANPPAPNISPWESVSNGPKSNYEPTAAQQTPPANHREQGIPLAAQAPLAPAARTRNGKGIAALVCGIVGLFPFPITGFWLSLIAIILGWQGHKRVQRGEATNEGIAISGFVLGIVGMAIQFLVALAIAFG